MLSRVHVRTLILSMLYLTLAKMRSISVAWNEELNTPGVVAKSLVNALPSRRNEPDPSSPLRLTASFLIEISGTRGRETSEEGKDEQREGAKFVSGAGLETEGTCVRLRPPA